MDPESLTIRPHDSWADFDNEFYQQVTGLKGRGRKVLLALGGWNDSEGDKYSRLVGSADSRETFIHHAIQFLTDHNFDGLDLDWEYPVCWQVDCTAGPSSDKAAFAAWLGELHTAFQPAELLLTAAVSPSRAVVEAAYDIPALDRYLDHVSVMAYDYHGQWDGRTGHVAPMYQHEEDQDGQFNAVSGVKHFHDNTSCSCYSAVVTTLF